jgi:predicted RNA-binding Zn ribbon-like protein
LTVPASREPIPVVLALANAGRPTRPPGAPAPTTDAGFSSLDSAAAILAPLLPDQPVTARDLPALAELARVIDGVTAAIVAREQPMELAALNAIARAASASPALQHGPEGQLVATLEWQPGPPGAQLARRAIEELGRLDPDRLRVCARPECSLLFYDTSRPNTQRWHSESPCGWRERQRRRRSTTARD